MKSVVIIECSTEHTLFLFYFPANGSTNLDVFYPKTICTPRGIISQNFSSLGLIVSEELGNKHTSTQTNTLTSYCFRKRIRRECKMFDLSIINTNATDFFVKFCDLLPK